MKLTLGFSPCPNDTFIFDALVNNKIDTGDFEFEIILEDVETLNQWALEGKLDITKLSFPAFFKSMDHYILLNAGSALGKGVGPLLISGSKDELSNEHINNSIIVLPGINTTANFLFSYAYPNATNKKYLRFDHIENLVLSETKSYKKEELLKTDVLGVIIHENRFTYQQKGLFKVTDLGEYWEEKMKLPIPLGGIAISQNIKRSVALKINNFIRQSLEFAFKNYPAIPEYVKNNSQEMNEDVMRQHIDLYVNNYSLDLGEDGKQAINTLFNVYQNMNESESIDVYNLFL